MKTEMKFYCLDGLTHLSYKASTSFSESFSHGGSLLYISGLRVWYGKYSVDYFPAIAGGCLLAAY